MGSSKDDSLAIRQAVARGIRRVADRRTWRLTRLKTMDRIALLKVQESRLPETRAGALAVSFKLKEKGAV